jgi:hypothetical protein
MAAAFGHSTLRHKPTDRRLSPRLWLVVVVAVLVLLAALAVTAVGLMT